MSSTETTSHKGSPEIQKARLRQQESVVKAIRRLTRRNHLAPTVRDLSIELQRPVTSIHNDLYSLREQGRVEWEKGKSRTLRVVRPPKS